MSCGRTRGGSRAACLVDGPFETQSRGPTGLQQTDAGGGRIEASGTPDETKDWWIAFGSLLATFGVPLGTAENSPAIHRWVTRLRFPKVSPVRDD